MAQRAGSVIHVDVTSLSKDVETCGKEKTLFFFPFSSRLSLSNGHWLIGDLWEMIVLALRKERSSCSRIDVALLILFELKVDRQSHIDSVVFCPSLLSAGQAGWALKSDVCCTQLRWGGIDTHDMNISCHTEYGYMCTIQRMICKRWKFRQTNEDLM